MSVVVGRTNTGSWTEGPSGPGSVVLGPVWAQDTVDGHAGLRIAEALGLSFLDFAALT
ncbi:hypothetical protein VTN96DRAFT_7805 [Rasamsonia emersonii]